MTRTGPQSNNNFIAAAALAVWAVVLLAAFFANRGEDVGRIASLAERLGGGPLVGSGIFDSLAGGITAVLIFAAWFGVGSVIFRFVRLERSPSHSHILELAMRVCAGAAAWSLLWFFLGLIGLYSTTTAVVALAVGLGAAVITGRRVKEAADESRVPERAAAVDKLLLLLAAIPVALSGITALAPPIAKDTLLYHFAVPKYFIAQGGSGFIEGNIASYLSLGTEMHVVWSMLLGNIVSPRAGEAAAGAVIWLFFPILLAAVFGFARELDVSRRWALVAVLMTASVPTAYHVAASGYIDLALACYVTLAVFALIRWRHTLSNGSLLVMAIFLGAALSSKLTTLFVFAAFALVILLHARNAQARGGNAGRIIASGLAALMLAGVIAAPWYLRTWAATGSPLFPFYLNIWKGEAPGWDVERSDLFQAMNAQYGGASKSVVDYAATPWTVSTAAQPELFEYFDGVLGPVFLFALPVLLWAIWRSEAFSDDLKVCAGIAAVVFVFWLFSSQQLRYLLPLVPIFAIAAAAAFGRYSVTDRSFATTGTALLGVLAAAGILVSAAWFMRTAPLRAALGGESRDAYLARNLDHYPYYQLVNTELPADAKVWLINMRRDTYHLERPYFSDYLFEDVTLRNWLWQAATADELRTKAADAGFTHILVRHDFIFDYDRSSLLDDRMPRAENEKKLAIAKSFLLDPTRTIRADRRFSLIKVF